jgi:hypothetical protein
MRILTFTGLVLLCLSQCPAAPGDEPKPCWWSCSWKPCPSCPDDYHGKPLPCVTALKWHGPDDYCAKPLPCVSPVKCLGPDDYCAKPCPTVPRCWNPPWFRCVPACEAPGICAKP